MTFWQWRACDEYRCNQEKPPVAVHPRANTELARLCLSSNDCVCLPDGATVIAVPFKAFIRNFCPELFQLR